MMRTEQLDPMSMERAWYEGLKTQARTIQALMFRDILSRFGHENLGFFWVFAEPMILMGGVAVLWSIVHVRHDDSVAIVPFALTGYSFLTIWRHIVARSVGSLRTNISLRYHRSVQLLDVVIARALAEVLSVFAAFCIIYLPLALCGICPPVRDPLNLVLGYFFIAWFSFAMGLTLASVSEFGHAMRHTIAPLMYISLPLTGVFTMQAWMPDSLRVILSWSPLVNAIEILRSGIFVPDVPAYFSIRYLIICCLLLTTIGLCLYRLSEHMTVSD